MNGRQQPGTASSCLPIGICAPWPCSAPTAPSTGYCSSWFDFPSVFASILDAERGGRSNWPPPGSASGDWFGERVGGSRAPGDQPELVVAVYRLLAVLAVGLRAGEVLPAGLVQELHGLGRLGRLGVPGAPVGQGAQDRRHVVPRLGDPGLVAGAPPPAGGPPRPHAPPRPPRPALPHPTVRGTRGRPQDPSP